MSAILIATSAALIASSASHQSGGGASCQVSDFGSVCLALALVFVILAGVSIITALTRSWNSKWADRWFIAFVVFACLTLVPIVVGMIHDC